MKLLAIAALLSACGRPMQPRPTFVHRDGYDTSRSRLFDPALGQIHASSSEAAALRNTTATANECLTAQRDTCCQVLDGNAAKTR